MEDRASNRKQGENKVSAATQSANFRNDSVEIRRVSTIATGGKQPRSLGGNGF